MKRALVTAVVLLATGVLAGPAAAAGAGDDVGVTPAEETSVIASVVLGGFRSSRSAPNVNYVATSGTAHVLAYCTGPDCLPERPARIEVQSGGTWTVHDSGTLGALAENSLYFAPKPAREFTARVVLPAYGELPEVVSTEERIRFMRPTNARLTGLMAVKGDPFMKLYQPGRVTMRFQVTPARAGRVIVVRERWTEGVPVIAQLTTDRNGRASWSGDVTAAGLWIVVQPGFGRSPYTIYGDPVTPVG